jgi:SAM-dependent methyltransferase
MKNPSEMPDYYRTVWETWYSWFAHICDPFVKTFCFLFNGGFGGERRWRESIIRWVDPQPGERILDICSGTGTLAMMLAERLAGEGEMVGIEISPSQLRVARKKEKVEGLSFIQGDAQHIPFSDSHFGKSVICGALHEMPQEVRQKVLSEAYRITKPGGRIVITEHNKPDEKWKANLFDFLERFNPEYPTYKNMLACGLTNEIEAAGFRIVRTDTTCWDYLQIVLAERITSH